jgi:hypothetical protein
MTPDEAKKELEEIVQAIITVYEQRLYGEEIQPYVVEIQKRTHRLEEYIDGMVQLKS